VRENIVGVSIWERTSNISWLKEKIIAIICILPWIYATKNGMKVSLTRKKMQKILA
jgi:hypothetical protein